jgi:hypothetical protein
MAVPTRTPVQPAAVPADAGPLPVPRRPWARGWQVPALLVLLHVVLCLLAFIPTPHTGGDNASYILLARSLLERGEYREIWDPAQPPHAMYPPVFAGLLALAMMLGFEGWVQLKLLMVGLSAVAVGMSFLWLQRVATPGVALAVGLLLAVAPGVVDASHWVLSDVPFWLLTMVTLWCCTRLPTDRDEAAPGGTGVEARREPKGWPWALTAAGAVTLAYFTRSAGLPLVLALVVALAVRRRWRALAPLALVFVPLALLWRLRAAGIEGSGYVRHLWWVDPYRPQLGTLDAAGMVARVADNAVRYTAVLVPEFFVGAAGAGWVVGGLILAAAALGWLRRLRGVGPAEVFFALYVATLLVWPEVWAGHRFLLPIAPLLALYAAETVRGATARLPWPRAARLVLAVALAGLLAPNLATAVRNGTHCSMRHAAGEPFPCLVPEWHDFFTLADRVRGALPEGAVVLSRKPTLFRALSGYPGRLYPMSVEPDSLLRAAAAAGAEWVVVDQIPGLGPLYLHPALLARRDDFCVVPELSLPNAGLARIAPGGPPRAPGSPPNAFRSCPLAGGP